MSPRYNREGPNTELKVITCNIPKPYLKYVDKLQKKGICPSRSEYIRRAIGEQILRDFYMLDKIETQTIENIAFEYDPEKYVRIPGYNGNKIVEILRRLE